MHSSRGRYMKGRYVEGGTWREVRGGRYMKGRYMKVRHRGRYMKGGT